MYIDVFILLCVIVIVGYIVYSCIKDNFNPMVCLALVAGMFICFNFGKLPTRTSPSISDDIYSYIDIAKVRDEIDTIYTLDRIVNYTEDSYKYSLDKNEIEYDYLNVDKVVDGNLCYLTIEYMFNDKSVLFKEKAIRKQTTVYKVNEDSTLSFITTDSDKDSILFGLFKGLYW